MDDNLIQFGFIPPTTQDASHHQDYYISRRGSLYMNLELPLLLTGGLDPNDDISNRHSDCFFKKLPF